MVRELQTPAPGSKPLSFRNHYSTGLLSQVRCCSLNHVHANPHVSTCRDIPMY